jgi:hypothetical protein
MLGVAVPVGVVETDGVLLLEKLGVWLGVAVVLHVTDELGAVDELGVVLAVHDAVPLVLGVPEAEGV